MNNIYIEYLQELEYVLKEIEHSWWHSLINKSIDKYNNNMDVSYYLGAYGGEGSFNDELSTNQITDVLKSITYDMAKSIQKQGIFEIEVILQNHKQHKEKALEYLTNERQYWNKEKDIERQTERLNYINYLIENYSIGNLHQITESYLLSFNYNNKRK